MLARIVRSERNCATLMIVATGIGPIAGMRTPMRLRNDELSARLPVATMASRSSRPFKPTVPETKIDDARPSREKRSTLTTPFARRAMTAPLSNSVIDLPESVGNATRASWVKIGKSNTGPGPISAVTSPVMSLIERTFRPAIVAMPFIRLPP